MATNNIGIPDPDKGDIKSLNDVGSVVHSDNLKPGNPLKNSLYPSFRVQEEDTKAQEEEEDTNTQDEFWEPGSSDSDDDNDNEKIGSNNDFQHLRVNLHSKTENNPKNSGGKLFVRPLDTKFLENLESVIASNTNKKETEHPFLNKKIFTPELIKKLIHLKTNDPSLKLILRHNSEKYGLGKLRTSILFVKKENAAQTKAGDFPYHIYAVGEILGRGAFGYARKILNLLDFNFYAVKIILLSVQYRQSKPKTHLSHKNNNLDDEISLLKASGDYIGRVFYNHSIYLIENFKPGHPIFHSFLDLKQLLIEMKHTLLALKKLHDKKMIHGDIRDGNVLVDISPGENIKENEVRASLIDMGLSAKITGYDAYFGDSSLKAIYPKDSYTSPDILQDDFYFASNERVFTRATDLYALGNTVKVGLERLEQNNKEALLNDIFKEIQNTLIAPMMCSIWENLVDTAPDTKYYLDRINKILAKLEKVDVKLKQEQDDKLKQEKPKQEQDEKLKLEQDEKLKQEQEEKLKKEQNHKLKQASNELFDVIARGGNVNSMMEIIKNYPELLKSTDFHKLTPLFFAIKCEQPLHVAAIINFDHTLLNSVGESEADYLKPLHYAVQLGSTEVTRTLIELIVALGSQNDSNKDYLKLLNEDSRLGKPLKIATHFENLVIMELLIDQKAQFQNEANYSELISTLIYLEYYVAAWFLIQKMKLKGIHQDVMAILHLAIINDDVQIIIEILATRTLFTKRKFAEITFGENKKNLLHVACSVGNINVIKALLRYQRIREGLFLQDALGNTALHYAGISGNVNSVILLVKHAKEIDNLHLRQLRNIVRVKNKNNQNAFSFIVGHKEFLTKNYMLDSAVRLFIPMMALGALGLVTLPNKADDLFLLLKAIALKDNVAAFDTIQNWMIRQNQQSAFDNFLTQMSIPISIAELLPTSPTDIDTNPNISTSAIFKEKLKKTIKYFNEDRIVTDKGTYPYIDILIFVGILAGHTQIVEKLVKIKLQLENKLKSSRTQHKLNQPSSQDVKNFSEENIPEIDQKVFGNMTLLQHAIACQSLVTVQFLLTKEIGANPNSEYEKDNPNLVDFALEYDSAKCAYELLSHVRFSSEKEEIAAKVKILYCAIDTNKFNVVKVLYSNKIIRAALEVKAPPEQQKLVLWTPGLKRRWKAKEPLEQQNNSPPLDTKSKEPLEQQNNNSLDSKAKAPLEKQKYSALDAAIDSAFKTKDLTIVNYLLESGHNPIELSDFCTYSFPSDELVFDELLGYSVRKYFEAQNDRSEDQNRLFSFRPLQLQQTLGFKTGQGYFYPIKVLPIHRMIYNRLGYGIIKKLIEKMKEKNQLPLINQVDMHGCSPLLLAIITRRADIVELLLSNGADPNGLLSSNSPEVFNDWHPIFQEVFEKTSPKVKNKFLQYKAEVLNGLHLAILFNLKAVVHHLINNKMDLNKFGADAIIFALQEKNEPIVTMLLLACEKANVKIELKGKLEQDNIEDNFSFIQDVAIREKLKECAMGTKPLVNPLIFDRIDRPASANVNTRANANADIVPLANIAAGIKQDLPI